MLDFRCVFFLSVQVWRGSPYFERKLTQFWLGFPNQNAISFFFFTFLIKCCVFYFSDQNLPSRVNISNRKLSSKYLLFRVNGKGRKFWMPTRKLKENFKNQKGSSNWGEDLSVDPGAVPRAKNPPTNGLA